MRAFAIAPPCRALLTARPPSSFVSVTLTLPRPPGARGPPLAVSPRAEWDEGAGELRWRLVGAPPAGGTALFRAAFEAERGKGANPPVDVRIRLEARLLLHAG